MSFHHERKEKRHPSDEVMENHYYCTIIVQQSDMYKWNYSKKHGLHLHRHEQVSMHIITALMDGLENDGFMQLSSKQSCG